MMGALQHCSYALVNGSRDRKSLVSRCSRRFAPTSPAALPTVRAGGPPTATLPAVRRADEVGARPPDGDPSPAGGIAGRVVLVTGSTSGIGAATAELLSQRGAVVAVNSSRSVDVGRALADRLPNRATYVQGDVAHGEQAERLVQTVVERFGRLDALVNNAGATEVIPHADLASASPEIWRRIFEVNVVGTWQVTVAAVPHLRASGSGQVVNVSSVAGVRPVGSSIPYACSKAAVNHMTRLLANTLGPQVRVNAVAPGLVDTPWTADWHAVREVVQARAPLRRSADPVDVARAVLGLMTADYVTGEVLVVDGGLQLT